VRELLGDNGDVPLLAAYHIAARSREFIDVPELDFSYPTGGPKEIDFVALADGEIIVGEAKKDATLGSAPDRRSAIAKLLEIGSLVRADQLLLCTSESKSWSSKFHGVRCIEGNFQAQGLAEEPGRPRNGIAFR
jgi:hypothetical protein